jgi:GATA-binding protein
MNGFPYDAFSVMPRTPSPGSSSSSPEVVSFQLSPSPYDAVFGSASGGVPAPYSHGNGFQHSADIAAPVWQQSLHGGPIMQAAPGHAGRPSLLQELYDHELPPDHLPHPHSQGPQSQHDGYLGHSAEPHYGSGGDWPAVTPPSSSHGLPPSPHALPPMRSPHESMVRRNTFPYVRHDHEQSVQFAHHPPPPHYVDHPPPMMGQFGGRPDMVYGEPLPMGNGHHMPLSAEPSALHGSRMDDGYGPPMHHHHHHHHPHHHQSPHGGYREFDDSGVKIEDNGPVMVPSQPFYRPQPSGGMPMSYLPPHAAIPIQHTDDAASKETQYLRRRCFNCHTTEPPSWRRSTLNPGKIVCNKCGLYERTHLRPRPLRFDELRAGNKARKAAAKTAASPKSRPAKKEGPLTSDGGISRRASVSSTASSVGGASSDWDDGGGSPRESSLPENCV